MQFTCKVCGKPVDPDKDIAFGAFGNPLFAAHAGACAEFVRATTGEVGRAAVTLLRARKPELYDSLVAGVGMAKRFLAAARKED